MNSGYDIFLGCLRYNYCDCFTISSLLQVLYRLGNTPVCLNVPVSQDKRNKKIKKNVVKKCTNLLYTKKYEEKVIGIYNEKF